MDGKLEVLMVIEGEIATTHLIERILLACNIYGIGYRTIFLSELNIRDFKPDTVPLFVRCGDPTIQRWVNLLKRENYPYIYYIDDNFWEIKGDSPLALYYQHPVVRRSLEMAVGGARCVITNSDQLALHLKKFNSRVQTLPAFFDFSLISNVNKQDTDELRIGFAGSSSRDLDLDIIRPVIAPVLEAFPNAVFEFAGVMPNAVAQSARVRFFPHENSYSKFIQFQKERNWSIGLSPLIDSESNRCKTNNKYREYGACEIPGIYSNVSPYLGCIQDGKTGLLVGNSGKEWLSAIKRLAMNESERLAIAENALEDVIAKHSVKNVAAIWAECMLEVARQKSSTTVFTLQLSARLSAYEGLNHKIHGIHDSLMLILLRVKLVYKEGGLFLVAKKSIERIIKRFLPKV